jgi:hypothetical protein
MANEFTTPVYSTPDQSQNLIEVITHAGDAIIESIAQSQELLLTAAKQATANVPKAPEVALPFPGAPEVKVPSAKELVDVSFTFADKWLATQKSFAEKYLALTNA